LETVQFLLASGADTSARGDDGALPIDVTGSEEVRQAIRDDDDRRTNHGFKRMREEARVEAPVATKQTEEEAEAEAEEEAEEDESSDSEQD
jgi:hypothetical protein